MSQPSRTTVLLPELVAELERRLAEFRANPAIAVPFELDYFENLKRQLLDERPQKAPITGTRCR